MAIHELPSTILPEHESVQVYDYTQPYEKLLEYSRKVEEIKDRENQLGIRMLESSGAVDVAKELVEAAKKNFPKAGFGKMGEHGWVVGSSVSFEANYDSRTISIYPVIGENVMTESEERIGAKSGWIAIPVTMQVLTGDLVIGLPDRRIIPNKALRSSQGRDAVERSMLNASTQRLSMVNLPKRVPFIRH